ETRCARTGLRQAAGATDHSASISERVGAFEDDLRIIRDAAGDSAGGITVTELQRAAEDANVATAGRGAARVINRQRAGADEGHAAVRVGTGKKQVAGAGLGETGGVNVVRVG